jgi:anaerobic selenocysteine-containing dehydrogenase
LALSFGRILTHFHSFHDEGRALPSLAKHNAAPQLWISRVDAHVRELSSGDAIKIYNERGEFGAKAHVTDDVPPGVVWIRDGWVGLNHLTSGDAVLSGDALSTCFRSQSARVTMAPRLRLLVVTGKGSIFSSGACLCLP